MKEHIHNIALSPDGSAVRIIDQTRLPGELVYLDLRERSAPAIVAEKGVIYLPFDIQLKELFKTEENT